MKRNIFNKMLYWPIGVILSFYVLVIAASLVVGFVLGVIIKAISGSPALLFLMVFVVAAIRFGYYIFRGK